MPFTGYRTTSPFGWRNHPITGKRSFHTGIDIVKSHRAPINAFAAGTVLFAGKGRTGTGFGGYGNVVLIKDKNNRGQVYAHLDSVSVKKGQKVSKGTVIGRQGNTGKSTGSHLHFEVRKKAQGRIPYGWIADRANNCLEPTSYLRGLNATMGGRWADIQKTINSRYKTGITVDNLPGPETRKAIVKGVQTELNAQYKKGLAVDGIPGPKTRAAFVNVRKGSKGNLTWLLQAALLFNGHDPGTIDGVNGPKTQKALREFQRANGLSVDSVAGRQTWSKLLG